MQLQRGGSWSWPVLERLMTWGFFNRFYEWLQRMGVTSKRFLEVLSTKYYYLTYSGNNHRFLTFGLADNIQHLYYQLQLSQNGHSKTKELPAPLQ